MDSESETTDNSNDTDAEAIPDSENTFDPNLATTHSYLGNDLEVLRGRMLLDNGIYINLPLLSGKLVVLFPGQTLPIVEYNENTIYMLRCCINKDRTFGIIHMAANKTSIIGTTAEIYEYSDNVRSCFKIKAVGRQRFKLLRIRKIGGQLFADVKILPEIVLGPPLADIRLASLNNLRTVPQSQNDAIKLEYKVSRRDYALTPWPAWVYRQYDSRWLTFKIHNSLQFVEARVNNIPKDPVELSFWVAQNIFLTNKQKVELLKHDSVIYRLQSEVEQLTMFGKEMFLCMNCLSFIGRQKDVFLMNIEGLQATYCNLAGAIHEVVTLYDAQNLDLDTAPPSIDCSWFPGYAWTIASCNNCSYHIGWRFTAVNDDLRPRVFWGLTRRNLVFKTKSFIPKIENQVNDSEIYEFTSESNTDEEGVVDSN